MSTLTSDTVDELCAVDLPGHGDNSDGNVDIRDMADALVAQHGTAVYIGYSFGARVALHIATRHPEKTTGLVLESGSAGIADPNERHARAQADDQLADHIETVGVPTFIDEWLANPLFSNLNTAAAMRADRLRNTTKGLADSLRYAGTGRQESIWDYLSTVYCPTLLVTGEQDAKFCDIATKMSGLLPNCQWVSVTDAGHTVHLEQPTTFVHLLTSWLKNTYAV